VIGRRDFLSWIGAAWPFSAMSNCYWVDEFDATQLCAVGFLPPLPEYWVRWDDGDSLDGSPAARTYEWPDERAAKSAKVAASSGENGIIVVAANYPYGDHANGYTVETYCAQYSTDYGFTYSAPVEYQTWQQGSTTGGYTAANANYQDTYYHNGTSIDYDGSRFVIVNDIGNNEGYTPTNPYSTIVTAVSTDGQNWTVNTVANTKYNVQRCAAYGGDIWYLSNNDYEALVGTEDYYYLINYSANDGASWATTALGSNNGVTSNWNSPREEYCAISANSTGCHVLAEVYDEIAPNDYGNYYWRPTSASTWAAPILLWDFDNDFPTAPGTRAQDFGVQILACRVNDANLIIAATMASDYTSIWIKRSTDGGQNWSAEEQALDVIGGSPYNEYFHQFDAQNIFRLVELDDGRLVLVFIVDAQFTGYLVNADGVDNNHPAWMTYCVSEDQGVTWSPVTYLTPWWVADFLYYGERIEVAARGVDVVALATSREKGSFSYIFRPTSTPNTENLRPPSMTLPTTPTTGWP